MKKLRLFLAILLAIVGASSVVAQTKQAYAVVTSNNEAQTLTVCKGEDESIFIPIYGLYTDVENTTGQMVYPAEMLANMKGSKISKLTFYTFASYAEETGDEDYVDYVIQFENVKLQLSLKEIEENGFSEATAFTGATVVATAVPAKGDKELVFTFDEPFEYKGGNLLVEVKVIEAGSWETTYFWGEKDEDSELKNSFYYFQTAWGTNTTEIDNFLPAASFDYENEAQTLTFYYEWKKPTTGTVYDLPWEDTPGWANNNSITTVTFDESFGDYDGLESTKGMFYFMNKLTTINDLEYLNTENVTDMRSMFYGCSSLETLDLSSFNTENVTNMANMFTYCSKLESVDLSSFDTKNVTDMSSMFYSCSKLKTLDLYSFDTENVTDMNAMINACHELTTIYCNKDWRDKKVKDSRMMFYGCEKLVGGNGTQCSYANNDINFAHVDGGTSNPGYFTEKYAYAVLSEDGTTLTFYYDGNKPTTGTVYDLPWTNTPGWANKRTITTVTFDASFGDYHGLESGYMMFNTLTALTTINHIEYLNTENMTDMYAMFTNCQALETLNLSSFNTGKVQQMSSMFAFCKKLKTIDLSNFDTKNVEDMSFMFYNCSALKTIYCAEDADWSTSGAGKDNMFFYCNNLSGKYGSKEFPFDQNEIEGTYAKVYDGTNGGYFTYKGNEDYTLEVGEAGMATLYLDYDAVIPEGVEVYCCTGLDDDEAVPTTEKTHALMINSDNLIPANTGVFVKAAPGEYVFEHPKSGQLYIVASIIGNILTGTLEEKEVGSHEVLTLGYANNEEKTLGFWWFTGKTPIPANRAYIPGDKLTEGGVKGIRIVFDEETGIATTNLTNQTNEADAWYTIDGRKLDKKPQQRGLYINNGKKIIIK